MTSVPPAAIRLYAADSEAPPTASRIRSNSSPSGSRQSISSCAPSSRRPSARSPDATPVTCAPPRRASWNAKRPTPPAAPVTSTRWPSRLPWTASARSAVSPATGSVDAAAKLTSPGSSASSEVGTATFSAHAPVPTRPTTRAPSGGPLPSAAAVRPPRRPRPSRAPTPARAGAAGAPRRGSGRRRGSRRAPGSGSGLRVVHLGVLDVRRLGRGCERKHRIEASKATCPAARPAQPAPRTSPAPRGSAASRGWPRGRRACPSGSA